MTDKNYLYKFLDTLPSSKKYKNLKIIVAEDPLNPENYMIGSESVPFKSEEETFKIKAVDEPITKQIRFTKFGVVVNELFPEFPTDKALVLRWSAAENMKSSLGMNHLLEAKSAKEANDITLDRF